MTPGLHLCLVETKASGDPQMSCTVVPREREPIVRAAYARAVEKLRAAASGPKVRGLALPPPPYTNTVAVLQGLPARRR